MLTELFAAVFAATVSAEPLARWTFDEGCGDTVWNAASRAGAGKLSKGMKWATGEFGTALAFTGKDSTVDIGRVPGFTGSDAATLSLWVRWNGTGAGKYPSLFSSGNWRDGGILLYVADGSMTLRLRALNDKGTGPERQIGVLKRIPQEKWVHLAVTFARPDVAVYVDGKQVGRLKWDRPFPGGGRIRLGSWGGGACHDGFLDDLRLYARALSAREVSELAGDGSHVDVEGYQDDGTGGVKRTEIGGQEARAALTLKDKASTLVLDELGRIASLRENAGGRELVAETREFARVTFADGSTVPSGALKRRGADRFTLVFPGCGEVDLAVKPFDGGWRFEIVKSDLKDVKTFSFCRVVPACAKWKGAFVNAWSDETSAVAVRSGDLYADPSVRGALSVEADGAYPLVGRTAFLAAGPRAGIRDQLKAMTRAAGAPWSENGGAWAMDSEMARRSYFFINPNAWNLERCISLAHRGGFSILHFGGWAQTLGHNDPSKRQFPGGLPDMAAYVKKVHDAGLSASIHTLTACIANHDAYVRSPAITNFYAIHSYTLAEPFTDESTEVRVNEKPGPRHSLIATYSTNGNYLRLGNELVQYTGIRREKPYAFTGIKRGVLWTKRGGPYPAGMRVDYPRNHYLAFYPDPDSPLADDIAERFGKVYAACGLDGFYFDGSEGMDTRYGTDVMRHKIFRKIAAGARQGPMIEASCNNANNWWFQTRMATTDHGVWGVKRFHDWHVASAITSSRMANFLEPQMGWWQPRVAVKGRIRGHYVDEMEYFASQNAGHDAAMSIQGVWRTPVPHTQKRQLTVLGWYERARLAKAFTAESVAAMKEKGAEFRLRQDDGGNWNLTPVDCTYHRADHPALMSWTLGRAEASKADLRIEALFAVKPYDDASARPVLASADVPAMTTSAARGVTVSVAAGRDPARGATVALSAANAGAPRNAAWAECRKRVTAPYFDLGKANAFGFWVKGDGSGALLNFVCRGAREYHGGTSEHYIRLDFTGWRYVTVTLRERDGYASAGYVWPYTALIHERLRTILDVKHIRDFAFFLNDIAPGASARAEVSEVRALESFYDEAEGLSLTVGGKRHALPFRLRSGDFAELEGTVWTHYSEDGEPLERATASEEVRLAAGPNALSVAGAFAGGAPLRVETTVFARGTPRRAFVSALTPRMRAAMDREAVASVVYAPTKGFDGKATVAVRPGESASLELEITGPVKKPALAWTQGGTRGTATFPADVAAGQMLICRNGADWKVVDMKNWSVVAEGRLARPLPVFTGSVGLETVSSDPAAAFAIVDLTKKYVSAPAAGGGKYRFLAFNLWGDFFKNPVRERDLRQLALLKGHDPDFIGLQEVTPNFWKSRLVSGLSEAGYDCIGAEMGPGGRHRVAANPVFFRRSRFELVEKGSRWFHPELDYSKGVVWAVVREKATGAKVVLFASHFWWQTKGEADDYLRLLNARMLFETVSEAAKRHGAAVVGGGDLNAPVTSSALAELKKLGWCDAQEKAPETDPRATWRDFPQRDANGVFRGVQPEKAKERQWLDHVFYSPGTVRPVKFSMDRTQQALDVSDHSPVIFDFEM